MLQVQVYISGQEPVVLKQVFMGSFYPFGLMAGLYLEILKTTSCNIFPVHRSHPSYQLTAALHFKNIIK